MYSFPSVELVHCAMSSSNYCFLICIQVLQEAGMVFWYFLLLKNFPHIVIHRVKGSSIVNEEDIFLEYSCFFYDSTDVGNLISGSPTFSKSSLNIWKFSVHTLLKPCLQNFECYFVSLWGKPGKSGSVSCGVTAPFFCVMLHTQFFPVLWKFCNQIPLVFKVKFLGVSHSLCQIPGLGNLLWALEFATERKLFGIIVLWFVGPLLNGSMVGLMATSSKRT